MIISIRQNVDFPYDHSKVVFQNLWKSQVLETPISAWDWFCYLLETLGNRVELVEA